MRPFALVAGRHHVSVPGEHQMRRGGADTGVKVIDWIGARLRESHAMHLETRALQQLLD